MNMLKIIILVITGLETLLICIFLWPSFKCLKLWVCAKNTLNQLHCFFYYGCFNLVLNAVPVATFLMAVVCGTDKLRCDVFLNMLLVSVGVVISSYGEIHFNIVGTLYQVTGIFAEALRLVLTQVLLQKKGLTLNPITSLYYIAPCRYELANYFFSVFYQPQCFHYNLIQLDVCLIYV